MRIQISEKYRAGKVAATCHGIIEALLRHIATSSHSSDSTHPPAEAEQRYYERLNEQEMAA